MFGSIFKPYGKVWYFCNTITDVLGLSVLWCFCSLPIFTIGAATSALYDAAVRGIRYREEIVYRRFLRTFRSEMKTGTASTILWGAILLFGSFVLTLLNEAGREDTRAALVAGAYQALLMVPIAAASWSAAISSRFANPFRALIGMSIRFLPIYPLASIVVALVTRIAIWYCIDTPIAFAFIPAVLMLVWSMFMEPVFRKYGGSLEREKEDGQEELSD